MMYCEKHVADVMIPVEDCPVLDKDDTVRDAVMAFKARNTPVILVMDGEGRMRGLLTPYSILRAFQPRFWRSDFYSRSMNFLAEWIDPVFWEDLFVLRCRAEAERPVAEIVEEIVALEPTDPLLKALYLIVTKGHHVLPVMRGQQLLGVVTAAALFEEVCCVMTREVPPRYAGVMGAAS
ncbi:MAG: CBS domain-containing protein [Firmicutes bacterium]|nr:CBS domain-containing protein [Bacillota bacterium]